MLSKRVYRARHLEQWNLRNTKDTIEPLVDKVVEAVLYQQGLPVEHTSEYRNLYSYDKLWEALQHYDQPKFVDGRNVHYRAGLNQAYRIFSKPCGREKLHPVSLTGSVKDLFVLLKMRDDTSAGLTAYGETKLEAFTIGLDKAVDILTNGKKPTPCLAGVRTQRKGKTRLVWMYPLEMTIIESTVGRPLIEMFKAEDSVMTFGDYSMEIGQRLRCSAATTKYHYSIDYSQFDASNNVLGIRYFFNAMRTWFNLDEEVYPGVTVRQVFDLVEEYFTYTPIVMPNRDGRYPLLVSGKVGGTPSGSLFTQTEDSFQCTANAYAVDNKFKLGLSDQNLYVLGDDCLFFCNSKLELTQIGDFLSTLGFKLNLAKGSIGLATDRVEYLGRTWRNGFPIRDYHEILRGALYPENYRRYSKNAGERQQQALSIASSYLLTSFIEDANVGTDLLLHSFQLSPWMTSGFTRYLLSEGFVPGKNMTRAIY